jgi:branched-chain amino acid transport system substrate-binding protein
VRHPIVAIWLGLGLAVAGCAGPTVSPPPWQTQPQPAEVPEAPVPDEPVRVGLLLPLSGTAASLGEDMLQAAQMALFDVGENRIELLPRDTEGTPQGAQRAAREVLGEGAELILGPLFGRNAGAVAPIARQRGVKVLAFSNDASVAEPGVVWVLGFRPEEQVERVATFAIDRGHRRVAALAPDDAFGRTAVAALRRAVQAQLGGELGPVRTYPPSIGDLSELAREIADYDRRSEALQEERRRLAARGDAAARQALADLQARDTLGGPPFDAVLLADAGTRLRQLASLLGFYDVDPAEVRLLGTQRWADEEAVLREPALRGGWYAAPTPGGLATFKRNYARHFGHEPQDLAALAYDAVALAVVLSRQGSDLGIEALTTPTGFAGSTGVFRLERNGLARRALAVLEVGPDGPRVIDQAPRAFPEEVAVLEPGS